VEDRISGDEHKVDIMQKWKNIQKRINMKVICKNFVVPLKEQTSESWALKKMCKPKE
jgi:hypothetical protein